MTTQTPSPDVREIAVDALNMFVDRKHAEAWADHILSVVSPVIRRQVAEEVAADFEARCIAYWPEDPDWPGMAENARRSSWHVAAAAIARSHAHPEEGK